MSHCFESLSYDNEQTRSFSSSQSALCVFCLDVCGRSVNLLSCTHLGFFEDIWSKLTIVTTQDTVVCLLCHRMLVKCYSFKQLVERSAHRLNKQAMRMETSNQTKFHNYQQSSPTIIDVKTKQGAKDFDTSRSEYELPLEVQLKEEIIEDECKNVKCENTDAKDIKKSSEDSNSDSSKCEKMIIDKNKLDEDPNSDSKMKEHNDFVSDKDLDPCRDFHSHNAVESHIDEDSYNNEDSHMKLDSLDSNTHEDGNLNKDLDAEKKSCKKELKKKKKKLLVTSEEPEFYCQECNVTFDKRRPFRYHMQKHKGYKCPECHKILNSNHSLKIHIQRLHTEPKELFPCTGCEKKFKLKRDLTLHTAKTHEYDPSTKAYCVTCNVVFKNAYILRNHFKTHSAHISDSDKKFKCSECDRKFLTRAHLKAHIEWDHLNKARFICEPCGKRFHCKSHLEKHNLHVHENIPKPKDKICHICGRGFTASCQLIAHMRTHTGERPLKCDMCDATFAHNGAFYTHKKLVHKVVPNKGRGRRY